VPFLAVLLQYTPSRQGCRLPPGIASLPQIVQCSLHLLVEGAKVRFGGIRGHPDWRCLQHERFCERQRDLKLVPTVELDLVLHRDVKAKDRSARLQREQHGALLGNVPRPARPIDRKSRIVPLADFARHLGQSAEPTARTRSASGAIAEALNALSDGLAVAIHAGHNDDATVPPVVGCWENPPMPKREDRAAAGSIDVVQVGIAFGLPANRSADRLNEAIADPADKPKFETIQI